MRLGDLRTVGCGWLWLAAILVLALGLRIGAFWLPHWRGDQAHYVILAAKLEKYGLSRYNLRGAQIGSIRLSENPPIHFMAVRPAPTDEPGPYLQLMKDMGQGYYDEPLHMRAPLFPAMLLLSHKIFGGPSEAFVVMASNLGREAYQLRPAAVWRTQFWAAMVPVALNLGIILVTVLVGWRCFKSRVIGLLAGFALATDPLSIWLSHKLLNDIPSAFFVLCACFALSAIRSHRDFGRGAMAGLASGLAFLTNQRMGLIVPIAFLFLIWRFWPEIRRRNGAVISSACLLAAIFASTFAVLISFWIWKVIRVYGHPLHMPASGMTSVWDADQTGWFAALANRPHMSVLYSIGVWLLSPMMLGCVWTLRTFRLAWQRKQDDAESWSAVLLWLWVWGLYFYLVNPSDILSVGNREHRYFYPAYPAIALLAGWGWVRAMAWLRGRNVSRPLVLCLLLALMSLQVWRGVTVGMARTLSESLLF